MSAISNLSWRDRLALKMVLWVARMLMTTALKYDYEYVAEYKSFIIALETNGEEMDGRPSWDKDDCKS